MIGTIQDEVIEAAGGGEVSDYVVKAESKKRKKRKTVKVEAYTISEFCVAHRISRATYYNLKKRNEGPDEAHVLGRIIITQESAASWRQARTAARRAYLSGKPVSENY